MKYLLFFMLTIFQCVHAQLDDLYPPLQTNNKQTCRCYCSYKCGWRDADFNHPTDPDRPFLSRKYCSPHTGKPICFCKKRDEDAYLPHGCQITPEEEAAINCCREYNQ